MVETVQFRIKTEQTVTDEHLKSVVEAAVQKAVGAIKQPKPGLPEDKIKQIIDAEIARALKDQPRAGGAAPGGRRVRRVKTGDPQLDAFLNRHADADEAEDAIAKKIADRLKEYGKGVVRRDPPSARDASKSAFVHEDDVERRGGIYGGTDEKQVFGDRAKQIRGGVQRVREDRLRSPVRAERWIHSSVRVERAIATNTESIRKLNRVGRLHQRTLHTVSGLVQAVAGGDVTGAMGVAGRMGPQFFSKVARDHQRKNKELLVKRQKAVQTLQAAKAAKGKAIPWTGMTTQQAEEVIAEAETTPQALTDTIAQTVIPVLAGAGPYGAAAAAAFAGGTLALSAGERIIKMLSTKQVPVLNLDWRRWIEGEVTAFLSLEEQRLRIFGKTFYSVTHVDAYEPASGAHVENSAKNRDALIISQQTQSERVVGGYI